MTSFSLVLIALRVTQKALLFLLFSSSPFEMDWKKNLAYGLLILNGNACEHLGIFSLNALKKVCVTNVFDAPCDTHMQGSQHLQHPKKYRNSETEQNVIQKIHLRRVQRQSNRVSE